MEAGEINVTLDGPTCASVTLMSLSEINVTLELSGAAKVTLSALTSRKGAAPEEGEDRRRLRAAAAPEDGTPAAPVPNKTCTRLH